LISLHQAANDSLDETLQRRWVLLEKQRRFDELELHDDRRAIIGGRDIDSRIK
jgi:hypothetical protein